ncbi:MAG TPA: PHP-associated domain-containing protein [Vicinamibacterales bacterium]|nr:PHP-associated domain-containing protein [Vicinamibacterales bacterium]
MIPTLRADLHVHTRHSTRSGNLRFLGSRDCYSRPADVYRVAKARGMDLVAFTDHDSIGGALELLDQRPDLASEIIVGEEVSCRLPDGDLQVHLGVYGTSEALHRELQPLRANVFDVIARLREADVLFALNHLLHFYRGEIPIDRYLRLLEAVPALEVRNGTMVEAHNVLLEAIAAGFPQGVGNRFDGSQPKRFPTPCGKLARTAGSDAHTLRRVGTTWTAAPGRTRDEFLDSVRTGAGAPGGAHGTTTTVAADAYGVIVSYVAALAGVGPRDLSPLRHAACLAFAVVSLPFQFVPLLMAARSKAGERRAIEQLTAHLARAARTQHENASPGEPLEREPFRRPTTTSV